jgi:hypothetical protein
MNEGLQELASTSDPADPLVDICQSQTISVPQSEVNDYLDSGSSVPGVCPHDEQTECYDFAHYSAGVYIDSNHAALNDPPVAPFANGDLVIVGVNNETTTSWVVVRQGTYPQAYMSHDGVINGNLETASGKNAGLAIFNEDKARWNDDPDGRRQTASTFEALKFYLSGTGVDYVRISLVDFGDWNAFNTTDVKIHFTGYDSNDNVISQRTWSVSDDSFLSATENDSTSSRKTLIVTSDTNNIKYAELTFSSAAGSVLPDPDMAITEICFPGSGTPRGTGQDDPHIVGFDGSQFEFRGHAGMVFNLVSDESFLLNCRLVESPVDTKTYMGALGIVVPGAEIYVDPWKTLVNGKPIDGISHTLPNGGQVIPGPDHVTVVTKGWTVQMSIIHWKHNMVHMNFDVAINSRFVFNPHGVLGQTARFLVDGTKPTPKFAGWENQQAVGIIEGSAEDYLVSDGIFGKEFTYNTFGIKVDHTKFAHRVARIIVAKASDDKPKGE